MFLFLQKLVLAENSTAYEYFIKPPFNPQLHIHIFNYTNTERFLNGDDDKLKVEDIGPYIYTEKTQKVNVVYNKNNTISYRVTTTIALLSLFPNIVAVRKWTQSGSRLLTLAHFARNHHIQHFY